MANQLPESVRFQDTDLSIIDRDGKPWLTGPQIGGALGYDRADAANKIYERHADEFTDDMTCTVKLTVQGQRRSTRIFSPRGCHLIGMFARTERAKAFRRWVLDVLEGVAAPQAASAPAEPAPPPPYPAWLRPDILAHLIRRLRDPHPMDTYGQATLKAEIADELDRLVDDPATGGPGTDTSANRTRHAQPSREIDDSLERFHGPAARPDNQQEARNDR